MLKKILNISLWVLLFGGFLTLLGFAEVKRNTTLCKAVDIRVMQNDTDFFITPADVRDIVTHQQEGDPVGKPMDKISILHMEKMLAANPYVADAQIYATLDGNIELKIRQRKPIVRIINADDESYYLDSTGEVMPLSENFTARTLVVNGHINEPYSKYQGVSMKQMRDTSMHTALASIYKLADYIYHNPFWKAQVTQVYLDSAKDFCLVPRVGDHRIIFGDTSDMEQKFNKLWVLYHEGLNSTGKWNEYSTINLKYKHQIVCTKN